MKKLRLFEESFLANGEEFIRRHETMSKSDKLDYSQAKLPNRMPYSKAIKKYKAKISDYFDSKLTVDDFDSVDDYYGYFEAKKLVRAI